MFFNGRWDSQFDPSLTEDCDFHLLDGTKARVPFMTGARKNSLYVYEGFKVLNLPYRGGRNDSRSFSMQIYLEVASGRVSKNSIFQGLNLLLISKPRKLSRVWVWRCHCPRLSTSLVSRYMKWDRKLPL
ncbi:unnamed protein product [Arabidopsis halleri]